MAHLAFQVPGDLDQLGHARVLHQLLELRLLLDGLFERDIERVRDEFGDLVHFGVGNVEHAADVADHAFGQHRAVGDDLGDVVLAVLLDHVLEHLVAPVHAEVHVDVRHADAFRVQEPFEQQVVGQGIEVRDPEAVGDQAAGGGTAARAHGDAVLLGIADEIPDDQEIPGKAHLFEHRDLGFEPRPCRASGSMLPLPLHRLDLLEAFLQAFPRQFGHVGFPGVALGHRESGEDGISRAASSRLQRSAIATVFEMASGTWAKDFFISSGVLT